MSSQKIDPKNQEAAFFDCCKKAAPASAPWPVMSECSCLSCHPPLVLGCTFWAMESRITWPMRKNSQNKTWLGSFEDAWNKLHFRKLTWQAGKVSISDRKYSFNRWICQLVMLVFQGGFSQQNHLPK